ncbi:MAG: SusD family outer membrane lipoprotein NanU [Bacteroides sp.]|nr:SusD family outer membrane lipoprotein NanU [Bacteroides sp.]
MKIKKIIWAFAASALLISGCTSLDMDPVSDITDLNYWKTPEQYDSFVYGLHSRFRSQTWNLFLLGEARSDVFGDTPFGGEATQGMERFPYNTLNAENTGITGFGNLYQNINQMNLFISRTLNTDVLSESAKNYYLGQVYGLHAYYMYQLYRSWGDAVFTEEPSLGFEVGKLAKEATPAAEIFEQVKEDIQSSLDYFGSNYTIKEKKSLWSKAATLMLKADVFLWSAHRDGGKADAQVAKNALTDIQNNISRSNLDLMDTYQGVFNYDNKGNKEIIFTIHNELFEYNLWNGNNDLFPQADYLGKFYNADGTLINTAVENNFGIMRLMVKLENFKKFLPGDTRRDVTLKDVYNKEENGDLVLVGLYPHKYWGVMNGSTRVRCDDYPIYRYSDLLLMLAEAKVLLGEDPSAEINQVRQRAFGADYDAATIGFPNQAIDKTPMDAILQERLFEFMLEGKRWYDLRRLGDSYVLSHTPAQSARLLWPINQGALTNNPLLKQTQGY